RAADMAPCDEAFEQAIVPRPAPAFDSNPLRPEKATAERDTPRGCLVRRGRSQRRGREDRDGLGGTRRPLDGHNAEVPRRRVDMKRTLHGAARRAGNETDAVFAP